MDCKGVIGLASQGFPKYRPLQYSIIFLDIYILISDATSIIQCCAGENMKFYAVQFVLSSCILLLFFSNENPCSCKLISWSLMILWTNLIQGVASLVGSEYQRCVFSLFFSFYNCNTDILVLVCVLMVHE